MTDDFEMHIIGKKEDVTEALMRLMRLVDERCFGVLDYISHFSTGFMDGKPVTVCYLKGTLTESGIKDHLRLFPDMLGPVAVDYVEFCTCAGLTQSTALTLGRDGHMHRNETVIARAIRPEEHVTRDVFAASVREMCNILGIKEPLDETIQTAWSDKWPIYCSRYHRFTGSARLMNTYDLWMNVRE